MRHDLTARVRGNESLDGPSAKPQVLLIDDQPNQVVAWLDTILPAVDVIAVSSRQELQRVLNNSALETQRLRPDAVIAALVDLDLGAGGGSGLAAIQDIRACPLTQRTSIILFTNGLSGRDDRDLHAVLCAYANGGPILASSKDAKDGAGLHKVMQACAATAAAGGPLSPSGRLGNLRLITPLRVRGKLKTKNQRDLVDILLGDPGMRALWKNYRDCGMSFDAAVRLTRDQYPEFLGRKPKAPRTSSGREDLANDMLHKKDFGVLLLAWHLYGESFLNVEGHIIEPYGLSDADEDERDYPSLHVLLAVFFSRYGRLLMARETHAFAENHMNRTEHDRA